MTAVGPPGTPAPPPGLRVTVAFLSRPESYPEPTAAVEAIETHMAWVFLTDSHAYKLKKPVRYEYLDFSTVAARRRMGEEEVRLNRRLAPDVYLGLVALRTGPGGAPSFGAKGPIQDWLVRMRRLPAARMLDRLIAAGAVAREDLIALGRRLARFYREAPSIALAPRDHLARFRRDLEENERELLRFGLAAAELTPVFQAQRAFLADRSAELERRVEAGRIVEGHGDLRPEHVCLAAEPVVIDCIEFNRAFRVVDPLDDLAYLALECRRLGAPWVGETVIDAYAAAASDPPPAGLMRFYTSFRAGLRAKIAVWHLRDSGAARPELWRARARSYVEIAAAALPLDLAAQLGQ